MSTHAPCRRDPANMNAAPLRYFRFFVAGKLDDRLHAVDMALMKVLLGADATDPSE